MRRYRRLLAYIRPYRRAFAVSLVAALVASTMDGFTFALLIPLLRLLFDVGAALADVPTGVERVLAWVVGDLINGGGDPAASLRHIVLLVLFAIVVKNLAVFGTAYATAYTQEGVIRDLRRDLFAHLQGMSLAFHRRTKSGDRPLHGP